MGEAGKGQAAKLAMNLQIALIYEGFAEGLTLAAKLGVDAEDSAASDSWRRWFAPEWWNTRLRLC